MEFTIISGGRAIRIAEANPGSSGLAGPRPAVVLLHGAGGNVDFWLGRMAPMAALSGVALYAVHYFDSTGTTRADPAMLTDGIHVPRWLAAARDAVEAIRQRPGVDADRVALVGISLGAFLSLALAAQGLRVRAVAEISGGLVPPYEAVATSAFPPVLIVHGERDTVVPIAHAHALAATLKRLGVAYRAELLPEEGHWFSTSAQLRIVASLAAFLKHYL